MDAVDQLTIRSRMGDYTVDFRDDAGWVTELSNIDNAFFIVDERVWQAHGDGHLAPLASRPLHLMSATEDAKTLDGVAALCDSMIASSAKRDSVVVSIGGGVVQDATGFLASVLFRGVRWVYVPSTLLGQGDSCIGAKTSINFRNYKNLLGTMYPPQQVIVHPPLATSLDDHQFASGLGEIVKMHIVSGPDDASGLEPRIPALLRREPDAVSEAVRSSLRIKQRYIEEDEFDRGPRRLLNFGHCFGHAIESATEFSVPHGQAVILGMILAGLVSSSRGELERSALDALSARMFIPILTSASETDGLAVDTVVEAMRHDKKRSGPGLAVVMPAADWSLRLALDVTEAEAYGALAELPEALRAARSISYSVS
jgi:3-dehydroquinate synthase